MKTISEFISLLLRPVFGGMGSILMFHRVCPPSGKKPVPGASDIEYTPERFEETIDHLSNLSFHFISLEELYSGLKQENLNGRNVVITFDDGYVDNFTYAYPILKKREIPFTIYVTTSFPDGNAILWWYLLEDLLNRKGEIHIRVENSESRFNLDDLEQRIQASLTIRKIMKSSTARDFDRNIEGIFVINGLNPHSPVKSLALSWEQIAQLNVDPMVTIGAHTANHFLLARLSEEEALREISTAREKLSSRLGRSIDHFAYPFGGKAAAGEREFRLVKEIGFKTATTTRTANIFPQHGEHLECLPRLDMGMFSNNAHFDLALNGWIPARLNHFQRVVTL